MKKASLIALVLCLVVGAVNAEIVTVQAIAEITQFDDHGGYFDDSISVGTNLTMTYSYDTEIEGASGLTYMYYEQTLPNYIQINMGNYSFDSNGNFGITVINGNSYQPNDEYQIGTNSLIATDIPTANFLFFLRDTSGNVFSDFTLPLPNFDIINFNDTGISFSHEREYDIEAEIISVKVIPEPSTLLLFGLCGLFLKKKIQKGQGV